jgi:hypothetical protein
VEQPVRDPTTTDTEVLLTARGIATAVAPEGGLTDVQSVLLEAITAALTGVTVQYQDLEPLGADEMAAALAGRPTSYRQRIVHHMVLAELVLRPIPRDVAKRVAEYTHALGVEDKFVRVARRYAQGAKGLAWMDLQRSGFVEHIKDAAMAPAPTSGPFAAAGPDPELEARWQAFRDLPAGTLGRSVVEMYDSRGFALPGNPAGASEFLARHDFVHVLADYGTNLNGELEVFALIGRADPDPKGFAWLATLIGLFETGYIRDTGFFRRDIRERKVGSPGMPVRLADAIRRGKIVCEKYGTDLFEVNFYELAEAPVDEGRAVLHLPAKSADALANGSAGLFERAGMSEIQQQVFDAREQLRKERS